MKRSSYRHGWSLYPVSVAGHHVQGAIAGLAVMEGPATAIVAASLWTVLYIAYQALTWIRKQDAAGLDVLDYIVGFGVGIVGAVVVRGL